MYWEVVAVSKPKWEVVAVSKPKWDEVGLTGTFQAEIDHMQDRKLQ
jgi:hypothetical protein